MLWRDDGSAGRCQSLFEQNHFYELSYRRQQKYADEELRSKLVMFQAVALNHEACRCQVHNKEYHSNMSREIQFG